MRGADSSWSSDAKDRVIYRVLKNAAGKLVSDTFSECGPAGNHDGAESSRCDLSAWNCSCSTTDKPTRWNRRGTPRVSYRAQLRVSGSQSVGPRLRLDPLGPQSA